ncbi:TetR/AcrR family transcriptional regulator [Streptomyces sp. NPDC002324]
MTASHKAPPAARLTAGERRAQLAELAARRFHELGYHHVSLADVAADAGVTAPAVYRHFRNKQTLLAEAIGSGLDKTETVLADTANDSLEDIVTAIAEMMQDRRYLWPLLQREARFLDPTLRADVRAQSERVIDGFVRPLRARRPELSSDDALFLVTAATSTLASHSLPRSAPRSVVVPQLANSAMAVLLASLPKKGPADRASPTGTESPEDRRTELLGTAIDLFFHHGYAAVSLDDIGAAIGIAGPSIYHHFPTKADILVTAFARVTERMAEEHARQPTGDRARSLTDLIGTYTDFCLHNRMLVGIYVWETMNLPEDSQRSIKAALRARVSEWSTALQAEHPDLDQRSARVRAHAAMIMIGDLARLGQFHERPRIAAEIRSLAMAALTHEA